MDSLWVSRLTKTYQNGPMEYRNGLVWVAKWTGTDLSSYRNQTSMGTRKGRVGYDRSDPNKIMYVWVGRYVGRYVCLYAGR